MYHIQRYYRILTGTNIAKIIFPTKLNDENHTISLILCHLTSHHLTLQNTKRFSNSAENRI